MPLEADLKPGERWSFDGDVAGSFDDMLARSIPDYDLMRRTVFEVGSSIVQKGTAVVDLGCSRGESLAPFVEAFGGDCSYVGVEISEPMAQAAAERFRPFFETGIDVTVAERDLRTWYPSNVASLTLAVLTLQFVPIEHRLRVLREAWTHTVPGGGLVIVEKVLGATADVDRILTERYWDRKREAGYSDEEIDRKRLALEGVLVPLPASTNEDLLRRAGFDDVDGIWRSLNFAGWVAIRQR